MTSVCGSIITLIHSSIRGPGQHMRCTRSTFKRFTSYHVPASVPALASGLLVLTALMLPFAVSTDAKAATTNNAQSPLGTNLTSISYWSSEQPLLNVFSTNGEWITHSNSTWDTGEEKYLNLDANGWPITLTTVNEPSAQQFNSVGVLMQRGFPSTANGYYPAGQYIVLYQGQGTIIYGSDAVLVSRAAGQDTINVATPTAGGIDLRITVTDPNHTGNYISNIRVVQAANVAALNAGQIFNPTFLNLIRNFHVLRFMDWLSTNNSTLSSWANRPLQTNAFWGAANGVPIEVAVRLANMISADAWLNVPVMADTNYVTQMATLVHSQLGTSQKVYVEFSNEVWNGQFAQSAYATTQGQATFPSGLGTPFDYNRNWYGMRTAQICDIWKSVWGPDSARVVCVLAAQAANTYTATGSLRCPFWTSGAPCSGHGIGAVAIAPYFGGSVPSAWASQSDGGLSNLFTSLTSQNDATIPAGGWLNQAAGWEATYPAALAPYKLPMIAYEGGQTFIGFPNGMTSSGANTPLTNLYIAANRDARMATAYTTYFQQWKENGGQLFMNFADVGAYSQYGEWGALESVMQTTSPLSSAPAKWQAVQNFMSANHCWWPDCASTVGATATPMAPSALTVR
jgi:hypothetical protein